MNKTQKRLLNEQAEYIKDRVYSYNYAPPLTKEDCLSFVFSEMMKRIIKYDIRKGTVKAFIYSNVRNLIYSYWKRNVYKQPESSCKAIWCEPEEIEDNSTIDNIESDYWISNRELAFADCLNELPKKERDIILLYYYDNLTEQKISNKIGITHQAVSYRINKALDTIKPKIDKRLKELDEIRSEL